MPVKSDFVSTSIFAPQYERGNRTKVPALKTTSTQPIHRVDRRNDAPYAHGRPVLTRYARSVPNKLFVLAATTS